ncbi:PhzF family phenazine biosynthesis protein [Hyphobacterium sp.]|uniref:PhzF family phenazine biosynthesis protein n=1 Tax=Hyphobacterium sp. TaxID=2004662 RepID=UPI003BABD5BB
MTTLPYAEVHAFSDGETPFTGNPAGVCMLDKFLPDDQLLGVAASNNLSETAFLVADGHDHWQLRWFTPAVEVDLCGHATFASGAWVFAQELVQGETARFSTRSGELRVSHSGSDQFKMDLPKVGFEPAIANPAVVDALGAGSPVEALNVERVHGAGYQMLVFEDENAIAGMTPDFGLIARANINVIATARGETADFVSRFFAPASGVAEDPVTGSAHCTLTPYWADKFGRKRLTARQIGPRPGALTVESRDSRVQLSGRAALYLQGEIRL